MLLYWGPPLTCFYNDAFLPNLSKDGNHPGYLGKPGTECWPEAWPDLEPLIAGVLAGGEAACNEDQLTPIFHHGNLKDVHRTYIFSPVRDESGQVGGVLVTYDETTQKADTLQHLPLSAERLQNLVLDAAIGVIVLRGEQLKVDLVNEMYGRFMHRKPEELRGKDLFSIIPEAEPFFRPGLDRVRTSGEPLHLYNHAYFVYAHGEKKAGFLNMICQPDKEADGSVTGLTVFCHDVTPQAVAQQKLEESEERFRALADHIPNLAWMASQDGSIFWYNRRWYEYTGTRPEQMEGWGWQSVHDPVKLPAVMAEWTLSIATGKPFDMVFPLKGADGAFRPFLTRVLPVYNGEGRVVRWFGTNTDVYEQQLAQRQLQSLNEELASTSEELAAANEEIRAANEEIQASNEELTEANRQLVRTNADLDNFIYTASHDLKTPIANIEGLLRALEREQAQARPREERIKEMYGLIYSSITRFKTTIRDLTDVARISKESAEDVTLVLPDEIVGEVLLDLNAQIQEANARLEVRLACLPLRFSRKNLKSIIYNLLSNAIKYRSPDREPLIRVSCSVEENYHVLSVEDNGLGMDMRQEEKIFALFKRLHNHVEGTGIGLYIVKKMIENAGGKIEVESKVGTGSTFRVYFKQKA